MNFETLENARLAYAKKLKIFIAIGAVLFVSPIVAIILNLIGLKTPLIHIDYFVLIFVAIFVAAFTAILAAIFTHKDAKTYKKLYKAYFVEQNLRQIFTDLHYNHEQGMPKSVLQSTGMIDTGDIYTSNDFTSGKYKDVAFSQADIEIQEITTDSEGHTQHNTIFKGRWMVFEFPKPFTFRLQVVEKWFNAAHKMQKDRNLKRKIERIHTESLTFDKKYKTYAEDGFEAYYILDPNFLNRIEELGESHKGKLMLCFIDNRLHIALNDGNDAFEAPNPLKTLDEKVESAKIHQDIKTITDFVDFLKLDRKLFQGK